MDVTANKINIIVDELFSKLNCDLNNLLFKLERGYKSDLDFLTQGTNLLNTLIEGCILGGKENECVFCLPEFVTFDINHRKTLVVGETIPAPFNFLYQLSNRTCTKPLTLAVYDITQNKYIAEGLSSFEDIMINTDPITGNRNGYIHRWRAEVKTQDGYIIKSPITEVLWLGTDSIVIYIGDSDKIPTTANEIKSFRKTSDVEFTITPSKTKNIIAFPIEEVEMDSIISENQEIWTDYYSKQIIKIDGKDYAVWTMHTDLPMEINAFVKFKKL